MKKGFKKFPLTCVEYYDHSGEAGWIELDTLEKPITCKTVGFLVKETDTSLHIMSTLTDEDEGGYGGNNEVLKSCIVSQKTLRKLF